MKIKISAVFALLFVVLSYSGIAQNLSFAFTTAANGGNYQPKHVLAVWIEKADGTFVKTLKLRGSARKQWLLTWNTKSAGSTVDAVTGSTMSSHSTHNVNWNCRDLSGNLMPDGNYKIVVEFTDAHSQGPMFSYAFTKSANSIYASIPNQGKFSNMVLSFNPTATVIETFEFENSIAILPNPSSGLFKIQFDASTFESGTMQIIDSQGKVLISKKIANAEMSQVIDLNLEGYAKGIYFLIFTNKNQIYKEKLLVI